MRNVVVTIARGFGSGGRAVGLELAEKLGVPFYDRKIIRLASQDSGIAENMFAKVDETLSHKKLAHFMGKYVPSPMNLRPENRQFVSDDNLFAIQKHIIRQLADSESCVIMGRCADYILRNYSNVVSVYIEAPRAACLNSITDLYGVSEAEAHKMIEKVDTHRAEYYRYYTGGHSWTNPINYDMTLNSYRIGRELCADTIISYLKIKKLMP